MRAGPLSNQRVIDLLNRYFVPVYAVNEDYSSKGRASKDEKAERERIFKAGYAAKKSVGTVHVYIVAPNGDLVDSMHVAEAAKPAKLIALLEKTVTDLKVAAGEPVVKAHPQSERPACEADCLTLHLTARSLDGKGAWSEFPGENWIVLSPADQQQLTGKREKVQVGDTWEVGPETSQKILTYFYPATENNDVSKNHFLNQRLGATVVSAEGKTARARLAGNFRMEHSFYHKPDGKIAEGSVVGFVDFTPENGRVTGFRMISDKATYAGGTFGVAVRSID
jgi:hypothetical protein